MPISVLVSVGSSLIFMKQFPSLY